MFTKVTSMLPFIIKFTDFLVFLQVEVKIVDNFGSLYPPLSCYSTFTYVLRIQAI